MRYIDKELLASNIESRVKNDLKENNVSGVSLVVKQSGEIVYKNHFGTTSLENDLPVNDNTIFRMASMTKPITGVATMILFDRGLISLDDEVKKYFPEFSNPFIIDGNQNKVFVDEKITVKHLLTHTSGIGSGQTWLESVKEMTKTDKSTLDNFISFISKQPLSYVPGTKSEYSAVAAFSILTAIIEKVTGEDFESFLKDEIFIPIGMKDTTFSPTDEQWERVITKHDKKDGKSVVGGITQGCVFGDYPPTNPLGGAGLVSTLEDYAKFADMLYNKGVSNGKIIMSENSFKLFSTPQNDERVQPGNQRWGLSVRVITNEKYKRLPVGAFGWSGAYGTHFWIDPENEIIAIYMKNSNYDGGAGAITASNFERDVETSLK